MKNNITICGVLSLIISFLFAMLGLGMNNSLVCCISLLVFMVVSTVFMVVESVMYLDFKDDNLQDIVEDDIDVYEELRKKTKELEDILK